MKRKLFEKKRRREAAHRLRGRVNVVASENAEQSMPAKNIRIPICFSELMDREPTEAEMDQLVTTFARIPTVLMLAMLNTFLSFYQHTKDDRDAFTFVQGFLFQNLTDEDTLFRDTLLRLLASTNLEYKNLTADKAA